MIRYVSCALGAVLALLLLSPPAPAADLIANGTFEGSTAAAGFSGPKDGLQDVLPDSWVRFETFSGSGVENSGIAPVADNGPSAAGVTAMDFQRLDPNNSSGDFTSIYQLLNIDVSRYRSLNLSLDVQVNYHNLVAGGWSTPAFEWPAVVQVAYQTTGGATQVWRFGWYLENPGDSPPGPIDDPGSGLIPIYRDMQVAANTWVANSFDLLAELPQAATITQVLVGSSGWKFQGKIDNVSVAGTLDAKIDIKPGSMPNSINLYANGVLPVAVLGSQDFDVSLIDQTTLTLAGATPLERGKSGRIGAFEDVNGDGYLDLMVRFPIPGLAIESGATEAILAGRLLDGTDIEGSDSIRIVKGGDANLDNIVDTQDFSIMKASLGSPGAWADGDFNEDGIVDSQDFSILKANLGAGAGSGVVPEPATVSVLALGGLGLLRRRRS